MELAEPTPLPADSVRAHPRLWLNVGVLSGIALGGVALLVAGLRMALLPGNPAPGIGYAIAGFGGLVTLGAGGGAGWFARVAARVRGCARGADLVRVPVDELDGHGGVTVLDGRGLRRSWWCFWRAPLTVLADRAYVVAVRPRHGGGKPIPVSAEGFPFVMTDALARSADPRPETEDGGWPPVLRSRLPIEAKASTSKARVHRCVVWFVAVALPLALVAILADDGASRVGGVFLALACAVIALWCRPRFAALFATVTIDELGVRADTPLGERGGRWDEVASVVITAVPAGGGSVPTSLSSLLGALVEAHAAAAERREGRTFPQLADDALIGALMNIGMATADVLPVVLVLFRDGHDLYLPATHGWHVAHAVAAEALHHGAPVDIA